ncbi:uncharacterized protein Z518_10199 [Rhinocladiella mackenziei CBS 650.93]|uniref:Uncharacterized protein n=1 Tax=Rhinocladiella mackenziei CBS 650.93 TaxID=1442369 RepID=A0A0D2GS44_9EURO|nr:uncharacterized protein Z518_10199 [Rhinocladiella mackenziei CBS 650.93]KIX01133.1 hypothetical protein Z518_10199 [Rhinocladiella mackenziei CBS 650.93]
MADTRCANPELQLDVDLMMLEYTFYHATQAQFDFLFSGCQDEDKAAEATRLLTIFDSFIRLFAQDHPSYEKTPEFHLNVKILELLVLLSSRSTGLQQQFSPDMSKKLHDETVENLKARRRWLIAHQRQAQRRGKQLAGSDATDVTDDVEILIYNSWTRHKSGSSVSSHPSPSDFLPRFLDLLTRFMEISAEIAALRGTPEEKWMQIACEFMLQASLESIRIRLRDSGNEDMFLPRLDDCFAWGYFDAPDELIGPDDQAHVDEELAFFNHLFRAPTNDGAVDESPPRENPTWTKLRNEYLSEFHIADDASASSQTWRVDRLAQKYPPESFQDQLVQFLKNAWDLAMVNKPVLVQIEEGHLKSLGVEGAEFDDFMVRVGLREDLNGSLKLKL